MLKKDSLAFYGSVVQCYATKEELLESQHPSEKRKYSVSFLAPLPARALTAN
jgi:hypothetical protein